MKITAYDSERPGKSETFYIEKATKDTDPVEIARIVFSRFATVGQLERVLNAVKISAQRKGNLLIIKALCPHNTCLTLVCE